MGRHRVYRTLTLLYPEAFRDHYRDDLVQAHDDLVISLGPTRAWGRATVDLLITVPRYRLETTMTNRNSNNRVHVAIGTLIVLAAALTLDIGAAFALIPLGLAIVLLVAQRTHLARSLRAPDTDLRRRRLVRSAWLAGLSVLIIAVFIVHVGRHDDWGNSLVLVIYNALFMVAAASSVVYLIAGLATKKSPPRPAPHEAPISA